MSDGPSKETSGTSAEFGKRKDKKKKDKKAEKRTSDKEVDRVDPQLFRELIAALLGERVFDQGERERILKESGDLRDEVAELNKDEARNEEADEWMTLLTKHLRFERGKGQGLWQVLRGDMVDTDAKDSLVEGLEDHKKRAEVEVIVNQWNSVVADLKPAKMEGKEKEVEEKKLEEVFEALNDKGISVNLTDPSSWESFIKTFAEGVLLIEGAEDIWDPGLHEEVVGGEKREKRLRYRRDLSLEDQMRGNKADSKWIYEETRNLDMGDEWRRYFRLLEQDTALMNWDEKLEHVERLQFFSLNLEEDRDFKQSLRLLGQLDEKSQDRVRELQLKAAQHIDLLEKKLLREHDREYNWLFGEWKETEVEAWVKAVADPKDATDLNNLLQDLARLEQGMTIGGERENFEKALELLRGVETDKVLTYIEGKRTQGKYGVNLGKEEKDRILAWWKNLDSQLRRPIEAKEQGGKVPISGIRLLNRAEERLEDSLPELRSRGARRGRRDGESLEGVAPGAIEGVEGQINPFMDQKWQELLSEAVGKGGPDAGIVWILNFLLEKDMSAQDQYYMLQHFRDWAAGAEGDVYDLSRATYMEAIGQIAKWKGLLGAKDEGEIYAILGSVSVGDMEDLDVFVVDYETKNKGGQVKGGIKSLDVMVRDYDDKADEREPVLDNQGELQFKNHEPRKLKSFEIGAADMEAAIESKYWFNKLNYMTPGSPANGTRKQLIMEQMFLKMGGDFAEGEGVDREIERTYKIGDQELTVKELAKVKVNFGDDRWESMTLRELADENLWMEVLAEANSELTMRWHTMNKTLEGRRLNYRLTKYANNYDTYAGKLPMTKGMHRFLMGYEHGKHRGETHERKPLINLLQRDFPSERVKKSLMPYLLNATEGLYHMGKGGKKGDQKLVASIRDHLGDGNKKLSVQLEDIFTGLDPIFKGGKFFDSRNRMRDWEVIRNLFDRDKLPKGLKYLAFSRKEKKVLKKARWDKLFVYLFEKTGGTKLSGKELKYFIEEMGGTVDPVENFDVFPPTAEAGIIGNQENLDQEKGARLFFETLSPRRYFWEKDEQKRFLTEANYFRQSAEIAKPAANFAGNPTIDNLIEYVGPMFAFRESNEVRELAYRNADAVLSMRTRFRPLWAMGEADFGVPELEKETDAEGYPMVQKRKTFWPPKAALKNFPDTWRMFLGGEAATRGWSHLDAWAKKNAIEKLWHSGMIDWWRKEKLMTKHLFPGILGSSQVFGALATGLDSKRWWVRAIAQGLVYLPSKVIQPLYLYLWIHDWGEARLTFWNEVVAPSLFGEEAKALEIQTS